jgi:hypothetical protein
MARLELLADDNSLKYIEVQTPFESYSEDECLAVLRTIAKDYEFYEFYLRFGRDNAVELVGGRTWPTLFLEGYITKMPSFYVYVIDIEVDNVGQRTVTVGIAHWLLGIYDEVEIVFRIYPERFTPPSVLIYLPFVSFPCKDFKLDYVEQENLTRSQVINFITRTVQDIIDFVGENFPESTSQLTELIHKLNTKRGIWLSTRLMQVLIYNQRLVRIVRDYMILKCECVPDPDERICYCNVWTVEEVKKFDTIYFVDAESICSNEVFFTTADPEGFGTV